MSVEFFCVYLFVLFPCIVSFEFQTLKHASGAEWIYGCIYFNPKRFDVFLCVVFVCAFFVYFVISSEGALYVILPYDYPQRPLFEHTPVLNNNFEY